MNEIRGFSHCMVDGDAEELRRARRLWRRAMAASLVFEAILLAAMLLLPLITPGVPPRIEIVTPVPPYAGPRDAGQPHRHITHPTRAEPHRSAQAPIFLPPTIPSRVVTATNDAPPDVAEAPGNNAGIPGGIGPGAEGGTTVFAVGPPAPASVRPDHPRRISVGVMEGSLIYRVQPKYPDVARNAQMSGDVVLRATIATDGTVKNWQVVSGNPIFVQAAIAAVRQWRYKPTKLNGEPVEVETLITVRFVMN